MKRIRHALELLYDNIDKYYTQLFDLDCIYSATRVLTYEQPFENKIAQHR